MYIVPNIPLQLIMYVLYPYEIIIPQSKTSAAVQMFHLNSA